MRKERTGKKRGGGPSPDRRCGGDFPSAARGGGRNMTEADFIAEILAHPGDEGPLLVFADWLEERGDVRGELIRLNLAIANSGGHEELERRRRRAATGKWGEGEEDQETDLNWTIAAAGWLSSAPRRQMFAC